MHKTEEPKGPARPGGAYIPEGIVWRIAASAQRVPRLRTACSALHESGCGTELPSRRR